MRIMRRCEVELGCSGRDRGGGGGGGLPREVLGGVLRVWIVQRGWEVGIEEGGVEGGGCGDGVGCGDGG